MQMIILIIERLYKLIMTESEEICDSDEYRDVELATPYHALTEYIIHLIKNLTVMMIIQMILLLMKRI